MIGLTPLQDNRKILSAEAKYFNISVDKILNYSFTPGVSHKKTVSPLLFVNFFITLGFEVVSPTPTD